MKRPCLRCGALTEKTYCKRHTPKQRRGPRPQYDAAWHRLSRSAIAAQPWCSWCGRTVDLTTDHIIPRSLDGGVQVLCRSCNSRKGDR